jgi:hypothetical protein
MNNQFKPGDLALIVGANTLVQNIGKVVELSTFVRDSDIYVGPDGNVYRHSDADCWVVRGEGVQFWTEEGVYDGFGLCEPRHLSPLRGDFQPERQKSREVPA